MLTFVGPVLVLPLDTIDRGILQDQRRLSVHGWHLIKPGFHHICQKAVFVSPLTTSSLVFISQERCASKSWTNFVVTALPQGVAIHTLYENDTAVALSQFIVLTCLPDCLLTDIQNPDQLLVKLCQLNSKKRGNH